MLRENSMTRNRWPVLVGVLAVALWAGSASAQNVVTPSDCSLRSVVGSDMQVATVGPGWTGSWGMGLFGMQIHSWGRASARSWSGSSFVAVLRERLGTVR